MRITLCLVVVSLAASTAEARTVVFSAPPELRPVVKKAIESHGAEAIDASAIDDALFNAADNAKEAIRDGKFKLEPLGILPRSVQEDWRRGLAGCQRRIQRQPQTAEACAEEFSQAIWQRYLEAVQPERVIEFKPPEPEGSEVQFQAATYRPADAGVAVFVRKGPVLEKLVSDTVAKMLSSPKLAANGVRPNSDLVPGDAPRSPPDLNQGTAQTLEPFKLPPGCKLPAVIEISPKDAPLAKTITRLWAASVRGHESIEAPSHCTLSISTPESGGTSQLTGHCGSSVTLGDIFAGTDFGSAAYQEAFARNFVAHELAGGCEDGRRAK